MHEHLWIAKRKVTPCASNATLISSKHLFIKFPVVVTQAWLKSKASINELPFKTPVTKSLSTVNHTFNSSSSQYCRSMSNTDSRDSEENYVPMQNPMSSSPVFSGTNSPDPKKSTGNVNYIALDFQPVSQSPHCKPSTSTVASDENGKYVQVDKEKTQALQRPFRNGQRCGSPQDSPKMPSYVNRAKHPTRPSGPPRPVPLLD
ncbi:GRB2-associated-binding protein 2 [Cricetulus griseus]|uniref:GRB2-associated-binding protein 2 n=1 Tax=Cricetulus griseus TaxID=10029 RepID=A0A061I3L3_CRIGR|nr:GRB2-associated-binding protein 2 [Cricetulus griseus]